MTADKEAAVTTHELTHATSTPVHEQKKRHHDCFDSTHRTYVSPSVVAISSHNSPIYNELEKEALRCVAALL